MADWTRAAREALERGPAALVTVLAAEGSTPREAGARMIVTDSGFEGTIGGGRLEYQATVQARAILAHPPGSWRVQDYPLGPLLGQCCGGRVRLLVERLESVPGASGPFRVALGERLERQLLPGESRGPGKDSDLGPGLRRGPIGARGPRPDAGDSFVEPGDAERLPVLMFGAGHVGKAIAERAEGLPLNLVWYDGRPEMAETAGVVLAAEDEMVARAAGASGETAVVILTHDHGLDYRLVAAALASPARFVGLIGSQTKRARFLSRLDKEGVDHRRLTCPIGLPGIAGKQPGVIAIATLAQLLALRTGE